MAIKGVIRKEFEHSVEPEGTEDRTIFILKPLSGDHLMEYTYRMQGKTKEDLANDPDFPKIIKRVLQAGLKGWRNLKHPETGVDLPFPEDINEALEFLPLQVRDKLAGELLKSSVVDQDLVKN